MTDVKYIERGYDQLISKLQTLGARITASRKSSKIVEAPLEAESNERGGEGERKDRSGELPKPNDQPKVVARISSWFLEVIDFYATLCAL